MHKLSIATLAVALGLLLAGCEAIGPGQPQDPAVASLKGTNLAFETVCMPVILDGADFVTLARSKMMVAMEPHARGTAKSSHAFRLGLTGVTASMWADGSCAVGAQLGDSEQLKAQMLASLMRHGLVMTQGVAGYPAVNDGVAAVYCSPDTSPLILAVTTPASKSSKSPAMIATLYRAVDRASDFCPRSTGI